MKLKTKFILKGLFHSLLQFLLIFGFAWYNNCIFEMAIVYICFFFFRTRFVKQYHAQTTWGCTGVTMIVFYIVSEIVPSKASSSLIVVIFTYFINKISYYVRDYIDVKASMIKTKKKKNSNRQIIIDILGKDNLEEESIEKFCIAKGMPNLSESIYLFLNNTLDETAYILGVDCTTITRRINKFIKESLKD